MGVAMANYTCACHTQASGSLNDQLDNQLVSRQTLRLHSILESWENCTSDEHACYDPHPPIYYKFKFFFAAIVQECIVKVGWFLDGDEEAEITKFLTPGNRMVTMV